MLINILFWRAVCRSVDQHCWSNFWSVKIVNFLMEAESQIKEGNSSSTVSESSFSLLSSLLSAPRNGLNAGIEMMYNIPSAIGHSSEIIYTSASSAVGATCDMIRSALPYVNPLPARAESSCSSISDNGDNSFAFDIDENHFGVGCESSIYRTEEDLLRAIDMTKEEIMNHFDSIDERRTLVAKLIELRLQLQEFKDRKEERASSIVINEHRFETVSPLKLRKARVYCEACGGMVWTYLQSWYRCKGCGYVVHGRCTDLVRRLCAYSRLKESRSVLSKICPERGLHAQLYSCAECGTSFSSSDRTSEPRLCDYTGLYFCPTCHWNKKAIIPARIIHNWDFQPRRVANSSYRFLRLLEKSPVIDIESLNPRILCLVEELSQAKALRESILILKGFLMSCNTAGEMRLLRILNARSHFVEGSRFYSMKDLRDLENGKLIRYLEDVQQKFREHVEELCEVCRMKGVICTLCIKGSPLFAYQSSVAATLKCCEKLVHKECMLKFGRCVRCVNPK